MGRPESRAGAVRQQWTFRFPDSRGVEAEREEGAKRQQGEETKNLRNTGTEGREIIKSIFGEQLEQDSS